MVELRFVLHDNKPEASELSYTKKIKENLIIRLATEMIDQTLD